MGRHSRIVRIDKSASSELNLLPLPGLDGADTARSMRSQLQGEPVQAWPQTRKPGSPPKAQPPTRPMHPMTPFPPLQFHPARQTPMPQR